jgi:hypothetical protein
MVVVLWQFRCYVSSNGEDEIRTWFDKQTKAVQGKFISRLQSLRQTEPELWLPKPFRWLRHECTGLGEIRFDVGRVQHRPLGFRSDMTFVLVFCAIEKGNKFIPASACARGLERKKEVLADEARSRLHDFILD